VRSEAGARQGGFSTSEREKCKKGPEENSPKLLLLITLY
jgi:hypothetical protein